jgi:hypothetical protein
MTTATAPTALPPHVRGDTFSRSFTLGNSWLGSTFTGGVKFTLRTRAPASSVVTDTDAVDQATTVAGEITFVGAVGTILIPASRTTVWAAGKLYWDLQGSVTGVPTIYTIDYGTIIIVADITRAP